MYEYESILIKNVNLIFPDGLRKGDVHVVEGKIKAIGASLSASAELQINESGLCLMSGVIDPHVHFRDPGLTHKEDLLSGSRGCAAGGVTTFFDMPNTDPLTITEEAMAEKKAIAAQKCVVNYNFYIGATTENIDVCHSVENVPGIKIFVGSSTGNLLVDDPQLLERFFKAGNRLIAVHSENERMVQENRAALAGSKDVKDHMRIRTPEAAIASTRFLVDLAIKYKRRLHICHLTTQEEAEFLADVIPKYSFITTEVSPQHLLCSAPEIYDRFGTYAQINPPLREKRHAEALFKALKAGTIGCIGTDHAPHLKSEKDTPFGQAPSGMPGVETSLPLFLDLVDQELVTIQELQKWMCETPAQYFGLKNKGKLAPGFDADMVLIDLKAKRRVEGRRLQTKCKWSIWEGRELTGWPIATFVNGQMVYREGDFLPGVWGKEAVISH